MISDVYFPRVNGVSTSIKTFRRELAGLGHEVVLVAPTYHANEDDDALMIRIPSRYVPMDPEDRMMKSGLIHAMKDTFREQRFDLIHIQTPFVAHNAGIRLASALRIPRVETYHTYFEEYLFHYLPYFPVSLMRATARWFSRRQCNNVDALVVPSHAMGDVLQGYGVLTPMQIIPTGIEPIFFTGNGGSSFRSDYGIETERPVLSCIGRVAHEKNFGFLLQVLSQVRKAIPDVLLIIAGEGPALGHLKKSTRALRIEENVLFVGYLDRETTLLELYRESDLFVFASRTETQGLVLLEAMALGVPVVSTAVMGTKDILEPEKGARIAREETGDFAEKVIRLLQDPPLRRQMAEEGREYAKTWSAREMAVRMASFYEDTIANYDPKGGSHPPSR